MYKHIITTSLFVAATFMLTAQTFNITGDLRVRPEYRHGYQSMIPDSVDGVLFVNQRSRLNFEYSSDKVKLKISPQNVRTWGDVNTTSKFDLNSSFHEAFGEVILSKWMSVKVGRQELNYDNARIFGNVDWLMQARSHDAAVFLLSLPKEQTLHIGATYNAVGESNVAIAYSLPQYKTFHYLWYNVTKKNTSLSFLALNNGVTSGLTASSAITFSQTIGPRIVYKSEKLAAEATTYVQFGNILGNKVNGAYYAAEVSYQAVKTFNIGTGAEYLSGKATNDGSTDIKSFFPLYGTNHKFNGFMDYFYVGNFKNSVGLLDAYVNLNLTTDKFNLMLTPHYFNSAASIYDATGKKQSNYLGTEVDLTLGYKINDVVNFTLGYSHMFASKSLEFLTTGKSDNTNNWGYCALVFKPKIFSFDKNAKADVLE